MIGPAVGQLLDRTDNVVDGEAGDCVECGWCAIGSVVCACAEEGTVVKIKDVIRIEPQRKQRCVWIKCCAGAKIIQLPSIAFVGIVGLPLGLSRFNGQVAKPPVVLAAEQLLEPFHEKAHVPHPPEE